jgi:hypothetical protein
LTDSPVGLATFMSDPIFNLDLISRTFDGHGARSAPPAGRLSGRGRWRG